MGAEATASPESANAPASWELVVRSPPIIATRDLLPCATVASSAIPVSVCRARSRLAQAEALSLAESHPWQCARPMRRRRKRVSTVEVWARLACWRGDHSFEW